MISTNFHELNDSLKNFILSVAVGPQLVIDKLIETANNHLELLESISNRFTSVLNCIKKEVPNVR